MEKPLESIEEMQVDTALIEVKQTTWSVDGDQLKFQGLLITGKYKEEVIVRYTIASEIEKENLVKTIPSFLIVSGELDLPNRQTNVNQFDYQLYLNRQDISYSLKVKQLNSIDSPYGHSDRYYKYDSIRQTVLSYCDRTLQPITSRYVKALIFGDRRALSEDVTAAFKNLGIIHLLSISGLHISLLIVIIDKVLTKLTITRESNRLILLVLLPVFGILSGFGISVFRAIVQAWVQCASDLKKWSLTSLDCWSVAFITALLINPSIIFSIGFQLSYTMSFLILFLSQLTSFTDVAKWKQLAILNGVLFLSSIPILSFHYFEFSLGVLLLNSLYIPFVSYILMPGLGVLLIVSPLISFIGVIGFFEKIIEKILVLMERTTELIDDSVSLTFISGRLSPAVIILWIVFIVLLLLVIEKKKTRLYMGLISVCFIILIQSNKYSPVGQIIVLDVGQGDSILIKEPYNKGNYLIDTGGVVRWGEKEEWQIREKDYSLASNVIIPVMKSIGIDNLDSIIITHAHWDHYGELAEIANTFSVDGISLNQYTLNHSSVREELGKIKDSSIAIELLNEMSSKQLPENTLLIDDVWIDDSNLNNQSTVLIGKYGKLVWLFTGDIEEDREKNILYYYPELKADVLKVPHHGSETSSHEYFLSQLNPDYALVSVGEKNRFGHPDDGTIRRLEHVNSMIYRTDVNGSIHYRYSENSLISHWLNRHNPFTTIIK